MPQQKSASQDCDPIEFLKQATAEKWLGLSWEALRSAPSKSGKGVHDVDREKLFKRCDRISPPPISNWIRELPELVWTAKGKNSGKRTWCLNKQVLAEKKSGEVRTQRRICALENWFAETATTSGFNVSGRRRAVDLVRQETHNEFDLIELKTSIRTNNPIFAAVELMVYAVFYFRVRSSPELQARLSPDSNLLLRARKLNFKVLAPEAYYDRCFSPPKARQKLLSFERLVAAGFRNAAKDVKADFEFLVLDEEMLIAGTYPKRLRTVQI